MGTAMTHYFGVITNRDRIKLHGQSVPFWKLLNEHPDGWLCSLAYRRDDVPRDRAMIWDCGAWSYKDKDTPALSGERVTPAWAIEQYQALARPGDFIVAPDHMLIPGVDYAARRCFNADSAREFIGIAGGAYRPMAVVHGVDLDERIESATRLYALGYRALALGGLAGRAGHKRDMIVETVAAVRAAVPDAWLHVLGISAPSYMSAWRRLGVDSCDGASHFRAAFRSGKFLIADGPTLREYKASPKGAPPTAPTCNCRACTLLRADGVDTRTFGSNEHNMGRAAHNLIHLMRAQAEAMRPVVALVACVGKKKDAAAPAGELYESNWFKKARAYAEAEADDWFILSAKHGLIAPDAMIAPYDVTLNTMSAEARRDWSARVFDQICARVPRQSRLMFLAGRRYREGLIENGLAHYGYAVEVPMQGLGIGQQLAWLRRRAPKVNAVQMALF